MKVLLRVSVLLFSSLILFSCQNNSVSSEDNVQADRRDYVWTVDTIGSPNNRLSCIWGVSPTDVWVGGEGGITAYDNLWHFNGNMWNPYDRSVPLYPNSIFGFAQDNIWMGGNDGKIFHFNGSTWSENYRYWSDTLYTTNVRSICGSSPDNIYAVGTISYNINDQPKSFILYYDGNNWTPLFISSEYVQFLEIQVYNGEIFISGYVLPSENNLESIAFYKMINNAVTKIFQKPLSEITWGSLAEIGGRSYFLIGKDLTRYLNGQFQTIISFKENNFGYQVYGRNLKDIFIRMTDGIAHYNGKNVEYLYHFYSFNTSINSNALIMDENVFFIAEDNATNGHMILQGSLNK